MEHPNEIILYHPDETVKIDVRVDEETVWLNRHQISLLFGRDIKTIGKHIVNALSEELTGFPVVAKFATTASDGKKYQMEYYNLDVIMSVGYRVKSQQGILFRQWANRVLKDHLLKGYSVNQRFERLEQRMSATEDKIDFFVRTSLPPVEVHTFTHAHDRFLILDDTVYHLGASIKDLGKRWFAFSKMMLDAEELLGKINP